MVALYRAVHEAGKNLRHLLRVYAQRRADRAASGERTPGIAARAARGEVPERSKSYRPRPLVREYSIHIAADARGVG